MKLLLIASGVALAVVVSVSIYAHLALEEYKQYEGSLTRTGEERAAAKSELGLGSGPLALYVGRLSPEKAPLVLLEAWSQASLGGVAQLAVLGEGPELEAARERAAAVPGVRIVGRVEDPLAWYRAADVYVLPSLDEGLSNSLLEALCCGLPVVATRISGSADVFREADVGTLVDRSPAF